MTTTAQLYHITTDIITKLQIEGMTEAEIYEFRRLMYTESIHPSRMILVPSMCERLNAIGLLTEYNEKWNRVHRWWLTPDAIANYITKKRSDAISELLS